MTAHTQPPLRDTTLRGRASVRLQMKPGLSIFKQNSSRIRLSGEAYSAALIMQTEWELRGQTSVLQHSALPITPRHHTHTPPSVMQTNLVFCRRATASPHMPESETKTQCGKLNCCIHHLAPRLQPIRQIACRVPQTHCHAVCSPEKKKKFRVIRSGLLAERST